MDDPAAECDHVVVDAKAPAALDKLPRLRKLLTELVEEDH
jgi:hypothetical protein